MATTSVSITYQPVRVGILVRDGNLPDLEQAAAINSLLWGGQHNPIIPIKADDSGLADGLVRLFGVDLLHPIQPAPELTAFRDKYPYYKDPHWLGDALFRPDWNSTKKVASILDLSRIADYAWERDTKHKPADYKSTCMVAKWEPADLLRIVFALSYGALPPENSDYLVNYREAFLMGLKAGSVEIPLNGPIPVTLASGIPPIKATLLYLSMRQSRGESRAGIFLGRSDSFDDLVTFWNVRATGASILFHAVDFPERTKPAVLEHIANLDGSPADDPLLPSWLSFYHHESLTVPAELVSEFQSTRQKAIHGVSSFSWNGLNLKPTEDTLQDDRVIADVERSEEDHSILIRLPEKKYLPGSASRRRQFQVLALVVDPPSNYSFPGHTLRVPPIEQLTEYYSRKIAFEPSGLRVDARGLRLLVQANDYSQTLRPIYQVDLITKLFEHAGITARPSQPGLIANQLIARLGGVEGARVLKIKGVRKLLQELRPDQAVTRGHATKLIFESDFAKHKGLYIERRGGGDLDAQQVFTYLLKKDLFRAGLELECGACKLGNWLSLSQLDDMWPCQYCGASNRISTELKDRGDWKYRKSGLFAKDNNQEGAIPVLLTLMTLKRVLERPEFLYTTATNLIAPGVECETDLCVLQVLENGTFGLVIGECKSEGGTIDEDDCRKLHKAYEGLLAKGLPTYVVLAKSADQFLSAEIARMKKLRDSNVPLLLFTNKELEPYHPYVDRADNPGVDRYATSLDDIAKNSAILYLA